MIVVEEYIVFYMFFKFFKCFAGLEVKLIFHMTKEGFCRSVVDAVSFSWHGLDTTHFSYLLSEAWMCIMESLIRVDICSLEIPLESRIIRCFVLELIKSVLYWRETKVWWEFVSESFSADHIDRYPYNPPHESILIGGFFLVFESTEYTTKIRHIFGYSYNLFQITHFLYAMNIS
jgi:hypothetical protein